MMITDIEDFFSKGCGRCKRFDTPDCSAKAWARGLAELRRICLSAGLAETIKWAHPCYMHAGRNIVIIGAFRGHFQLGFFNPALMRDPEGVMEKQGPNTASPNAIRFTDNARVAAMEPVIAAYLAEAMAYAKAGILPAKEPGGIELPNELVDALDADPELAEAFRTMTPGRQKSYVFILNGAKAPATRVARIAKYRDHILAGKGATER